jgi:ankyrin repeat protein
MKDTKNIFDDNLNGIGTEEDNTESSNIIQNGGDFFSFLFGSDAGNYASKLILDSFNNKAIQIGLYVIKHSLMNKVKLGLGNKDKDDRTILHLLVIYSSKIPFAKELLFEILYTPGISKYINKQDKYGNTLAHYALYLQMNDVIGLLVKKGANLTIENKDGLKIVLEEEYKKPTVFTKKKQVESISDFDAAKIAKNIVDQFVSRTDDLESDTLHFNRNEIFTQMTDNEQKNTRSDKKYVESDETMEIL